MTLNVKEKLKEIITAYQSDLETREFKRNEGLNSAARIIAEVVVEWFESALRDFNRSDVDMAWVHDAEIDGIACKTMFVSGSIAVMTPTYGAFLLGMDEISEVVLSNSARNGITNKEIIDAALVAIKEMMLKKHHLIIDQGCYDFLTDKLGYNACDWCFTFQLKEDGVQTS
jgi:hypothetical protein